MKLKRRKISGREKDEVSIKLLGRLREKLYSDNASIARRAAFNLSWMQEDGLDTLKEALFSETGRKTKSAAAYGLRRMHGRMKKAALEVFKQGLEYANNDTRDVCRNALSQVGDKAQEKPLPERAARVGRIGIREIPTKTKRKRKTPQSRQRRAPSAR